jgi:hypothetical protein
MLLNCSVDRFHSLLTNQCSCNAPHRLYQTAHFISVFDRSKIKAAFRINSNQSTPEDPLTLL